MGRKILFTGGGTAGHVTPNLPLIEACQQLGWEVEYAGSKNGIEKQLVMAEGIPYHEIQSGKLRRYLSFKNISDLFRIGWAILQSLRLMHRLKPDLVFSKGGFVAVPVVIAAWLNRIPIIVHESDRTPGLANRICLPFASKICLTFAEAKDHLKAKEKAVVTGTPLRNSLFQGDKNKGMAFSGLHENKPCLLVMGGSQGAATINRCLREGIDEFLTHFQIIHLCGQGNIDKALSSKPGYCQLEYAHQEMGDLFAASDVIVSRAGANAVYEILALGKPHLFIPLPLSASRGDQIENARYFERAGVSRVIANDDLTVELLMKSLTDILQNRQQIKDAIAALNIRSGTDAIMDLIQEKVNARQSANS